MTSVGKPGRGLKPIDDFITTMTALPQLRTKLGDDDLETLLCDLYSIARRKVASDNTISQWQRAIASMRKGLTSMRDIKKCLDQAAGRFDKILAEHPAEVTYLDDMAEANLQQPFSEALSSIVESLRRMYREAEVVEGTIAANIHPERRKPDEVRVVNKYRLAGSSDDSCKFLRTVTPVVDHWFIGAAADCLQDCEKSTGIMIRGKATIIQKLFDTLGEGRSEDSIAKELRRQKTQGRPKLNIYPRPEDNRYGPDLLP